jgi:hypothetical protein
MAEGTEDHRIKAPRFGHAHYNFTYIDQVCWMVDFKASSKYIHIYIYSCAGCILFRFGSFNIYGVITNDVSDCMNLFVRIAHII